MEQFPTPEQNESREQQIEKALFELAKTEGLEREDEFVVWLSSSIEVPEYFEVI